MGLEYELKYTASPEILESIANVLPEPTGSYAMETTYYDTEKGDLAAGKYTLRKRLENGVSICTVKTPAAEGGRGEWECQKESIEEAIPELCKLGGPEELLALTADGVKPICGARFQRTTWDIFLGESYVELALDKGVLLGGGKEQPFCEVEVELKEGQREIADAFAKDLAQACGMTQEPKSKFRRAMDLAIGE